MTQEFYSKIETLLKKDSRFVDKESEGAARSGKQVTHGDQQGRVVGGQVLQRPRGGRKMSQVRVS